MNLIRCYLTDNDCYKAGRTITPKGVMVHSTGANNPLVARYVQPSNNDPDRDSLQATIGGNRNNNDWNNPGLDVCTHAFIGKLAAGGVGTVQTLPWNYLGWHAGYGKKGSANNTHIAFEICEDALKSSTYFRKVYQEAVELTAMLCKTYNLNPMADGVVICHSEGCQRGIASNHGDVMHWFPKFGKSMDTFRSDVFKAMGSGSGGSTDAQEKDLTAIAKEVIAGKWGNGTDRAQRLTAAGYDAKAVQNRVNQLLGISGGTTTQPAKKDLTTIAREVIAGKWGNGTDRAKRLSAAGYDAKAVQAKVNQLLSCGSAPSQPAKPAQKTVEQIAREVIAGKWGNGADRAKRLTAAGYDAKAVQNKVNQLLR